VGVRISEVHFATEIPEIFDAMKDYIVQHGGDFQNWFVGVTSDVDRSLFVEHRVYNNRDLWIYRKCTNNRAVENIKGSLIKLGCKGYLGGWVNDPTIVYAYHKSAHTRP